MSSLKSRFTRLSAGLIVTTALTLGAALPAFASDDTTANLTGGSLSITNPAAADFTPVTLDGWHITRRPHWRRLASPTRRVAGLAGMSPLKRLRSRVRLTTCPSAR